MGIVESELTLSQNGLAIPSSMGRNDTVIVDALEGNRPPVLIHLSGTLSVGAHCTAPLLWVLVTVLL